MRQGNSSKLRPNVLRAASKLKPVTMSFGSKTTAQSEVGGYDQSELDKKLRQQINLIQSMYSVQVNNLQTILIDHAFKFI